MIYKLNIFKSHNDIIFKIKINNKIKINKRKL